MALYLRIPLPDLDHGDVLQYQIRLSRDRIATIVLHLEKLLLFIGTRNFLVTPVILSSS